MQIINKPLFTKSANACSIKLSKIVIFDKLNEKVELISSIRNGSFGGGSSFLAAVVAWDFDTIMIPLLIGVVTTLLTTTLSFFWKRFLVTKFGTKEEKKQAKEKKNKK